ncbi:Receptor-type tyrosine-protein phosphatase F, partial [Geodia barretti]
MVSETLTVRVASAPTNLTLEVQSGGTSVLLTWIPPDPLGDTTGYRISFTGGGSSGSVDVGGGSTNNYTLTGLIRGETYDISIVGTSDHISSESVELSVTLVPGPYLTVEVIMMGVSSISLSWRVSGDAVVGSEVVWRAVSGPGGRDSSGSITSTSYTIRDLQTLSVYSVTVTVRTMSLGNFSESVIAFTVPACESSGSSSEAVAALSGVLGVVIVSAIAVQVMVIVFFMKKLQRAEEYTATLAAQLKRSGITASGTSYTLNGLEEGTEYSITVTVTLTGNRGTQEGSTTATTLTAAPSTPPTDVVVRVESSTSITVQWGPVECIHQNGEITSYWVTYGEEGSSEEARNVQMVSGDSSGGMTTVFGLTKETVYIVQVAAVTSGGTGVYSDPPTIQTSDG